MVPCADDDAAERLQKELGCSELAARLLVNRGLSTPEAAAEFLNPQFSHLSDPFMLPDAETAAERIKQALGRKEKIVVHGDYDGDGVTSAALWGRLLEKLGADPHVHVPHRKRDGYDMRSWFVQEAKRKGAGLIITADCGIQRCAEVEEAREAGIDVIITDHHEPGPELPKALAVVNPHRRDSSYPFPHLAGVGVAYRMGEALVRHLGQPIDGYRRAYSDLAAIGTVTDIVQLLGENRVIVWNGLKELQETKKPGLRALIASAGIKDRFVDADSIGYRIGPRLNAIGRIDDAAIALRLLTTRDPVEAAALAETIEEANDDRRQEETRILNEALEQLAKTDTSDSYCLVIAGENWHAGVIGIVASKIRERTGKPTIMIATDAASGTARGSARSVRGFNIHDAIASCAELLNEFGGHEQAAGLSISLDQISTFASAVGKHARATLTEEDVRPSFDIEADIDPTQVDLRLLRELSRFEPWGRGNPHPLFVSRNMRIADIMRMKEGVHLKLRMDWDGIRTPDALYWNAGDLADHLHVGDHLDLVYRPQPNEWNGRTSIQFNLQDLRPSDTDDW